MLTAFIWGMCFVAQRSGMESVGPFLFNGIRELLGSVTLIVGLVAGQLFNRLRANTAGGSAKPLGDNAVSMEAVLVGEVPPQVNIGAALKNPTSFKNYGWRFYLLSGIICGLVLYFACNLQQMGMVYVTASKAAFVTTMYIVLVPIIGMIFRQKTHWNTWIGVAIALVGLYLLCINEAFSVEPGDAILLASALFWALHILVVGHFAPALSSDGLIKFCTVQFAVAGLLSLLSAPVADHLFVAVPLTLESLSNAMPEIAYAGILSTGVAFTLAAVGQKYAKPGPAAVIMSLESVFGLLGGVVLLGEVMNGREITGCILMFVAVIMAQVTFKKRTKPNKQPELR
jgi:drug/metabolite transporter (DMT)-like permease